MNTNHDHLEESASILGYCETPFPTFDKEGWNLYAKEIQKNDPVEVISKQNVFQIK